MAGTLSLWDIDALMLPWPVVFVSICPAPRRDWKLLEGRDCIFDSILCDSINIY